MKQKLKSIVSVFLIAAMMLGICGSALAASAVTQTSFTITITSEKSGHTYEAYQIFTGDIAATPSDATSKSTGYVLSNIKWGSGVDGDSLLKALQETKDSSLEGLFTNCGSAADVAAVLADYGDDTAVVQAFAQLVSENLKGTVAGTSTQSASPYTITGLSAGYYLVKDKDGSVTADGDAYTDIILQVVGDVSVKAKAEYPTVTKTVDKEDAGIGDTITYTLTGTVPDTSAYSTYNYIFWDTLSEGLTYGSIQSVTVDDGSGTVKTLEAIKDYTISLTASGNTRDTTITINIKDAKNYSGSTITVEYTATLNSNAVIGKDGNTNKVYVMYSNNPNGTGYGKTAEDEVVTFTFELDVLKVNGSTYDETTDTYTEVLKGAEFVLYKVVEGTNYYVVVDSDNKVTGWTKNSSSKCEENPSDANYASTLTSDENGAISVIGLDVGTYYLQETEAPTGFNLLSAPVKVEVSAKYVDTDNDNLDEVSSLTVTVNDGKSIESIDADKSSVDITVENNAGSILPSTGGVGTTIFYIIGGILVAGAAVLLITKKRLGKQE